MSQSRMLELAHERLYWPEPSQIWEPSGSGPKVYAQLASEKIGEKIKRKFPDDARDLDVSVLAANPEGDETEAPIAIVCQFSRPVSPSVIKETHRLAWSFSRARSLITIEPHLLRVWSCCEPPATQDVSTQEGQQVLNLDSRGSLDPVCRITEEDLDLVSQASKALQWVELVSGQFFQKPEHENRFKKNGAADQMLLENLKEVRQQLHDDGLDYETIHDLLARLIFIQFLFQKQDSEGRYALSETLLQDWHNQGILSKSYKSLPEILDSFDDTYSLFRCLNTKFNGDLFPGKGETEEECEREWQAEIQKVWTEDNRYLVKLAQFVRGNLRMQDGQLSLWPYYSFDVIPLDFISSIYEEFVKQPEKASQKEKKSKKQRKSRNAKDSVHYTPEYIVDFILDGVLPWDDKEWNLKILDPACGSGIFLVKAFQRLIHRWELNHNGQNISPNVLKALLENNIFGVDIDGEAVRVASFSLYLTMLDCIDPLKYWEKEVRFPRLRERRLIAADFFREDKEGFCTKNNAGTYDLVLGNAPWGKNSVKLSTYAEAWQARPENHGKWKFSYGNIGLLFLPKAAALTKQGGRVAMMQPAMPMLFNQSGPAKEFRYQLFSEFRIEEIVNLSALRFNLFEDAISPTCIVTFRNLQPSNDEPLTYICPKPELTDEDNYRLVIEPQDISFVYPDEAQSLPYVWAALMWGGKRDLFLIKHLSQFPTIASLRKQGIFIYSQGIKKGSKERYEAWRGRRILESNTFPDGTFLYLRANELPINEDVDFERSRKKQFQAFTLPQLIIKQSWVTEQGRFTAALVETTSGEQQGVLCKESFVSVHADEENAAWLEAAWLSYNSQLAVYYLFLTSGRFASFIHEVKPNDLMKVPLPKANPGLLASINQSNDIDDFICRAFSFKDSEWVLIKDLTEYTLLDFKGSKSSPGRRRTHRLATNSSKSSGEPELKNYCKFFLSVMKAGFGQDKEICATIFQELSEEYLPVRLVAIYLNKSIHKGIKVKPINSQLLLDLLNQLNGQFMEQGNSGAGGIFYQRVARVYASTTINGEQVPTVYLIKPDKIRYWTRSMALRDADEVSADLMLGRTDFQRDLETVPQ